MSSTVAHLLVPPLLAVLGLWPDPVPAADVAVWPLDPRPQVAEGFSPPAEEWGAGHRGVDLEGRPGQTVRAAKEGTVTFAGMLAGRGVVVVDHGSTRTTYEPVTASVSPGDRVGAGQPIGSLETFGSHCWPATCLHWGLIEGETYLDPLTLVGGGPVRLLPLYSWLALPPGTVTEPRLVTPGPQALTPAGVPGGTPGAAVRW